LSLDLFTVREVARLLRVSRATVYRLVSVGKLSHARVSNSIRIFPEAVRLLLEGGVNETPG
jgi:excisionase family DNA binding protein